MSAKAIGLREAAARLGMSYGNAWRKVNDGTFPVPELPRKGLAWHRFSSAVIDAYLAPSGASVEDARKETHAHL